MSLAPRFLLVFILSGLFGFAAVAEAQLGRPISRSASFVDAPRSVRQYLREAEESIADEQYSDAVIRLGDMLAREPDPALDEDLSGQDYFVEAAEAADRGAVLRESVLRQARQMLAELPADGLETYELRYGPPARRELAAAVESRDIELLRGVRRKYFHTRAGYQASLLLAQDAIYRGQPLAASLLLDEIVATPQALETLGDSVVLMHAAACQLGGRELPEVPQRSETVTLGGEEQPWPSEQELADWIDRQYHGAERTPRSSGSEHALRGGVPDRNGSDAGEMPLSLELWIQRATASPSQERQVRERSDELVARGALAPPSWTPLLIGDYVLMKSTERLLGVDFNTGKLVWEYPWTSPSPTHDETGLTFDMLADDGDRSDLLMQRIWNDQPYGQITSDGERVYQLHDLGQVEGATFGPWGQRGTRPADGSRNSLVALKLATEGKLAWSLGNQEDNPTDFSEAFFLGPPLPIDGRLYVLVELSGDICLSCLDPATGSEFWRQPLVAVESGGVEVDPIRRVAGAVPTYHEGVLICPTGAGAMVAFDLADRTLRWGVSFKRSAEFERRAFGRTGSVDVMQLMQRWSDGTAVASGTDVVVTPVESDRALGYDLITGEARFNGINRIHFRYLAGIRDGRFYLVGSDRMQAYDLETGSSLWSTPEHLVAAGQRISGHGMFGDGEYFLPTTNNQIIRVSLEDGTVLGRRSCNFSLGNLVAVDGKIISQSPTELAVALGEATLEPRVTKLLAEDPDDFDALVRKSQLLIQRGEREEALQLLEKTRQRQPDNDEVRMLSVLAMLGILREDPAADPDLYDVLDDLVDQPESRAELISLRVRAGIAGSDYSEAISQLIRLSDLVGQPTAFPEPFDTVGGEEPRQCSIDSWIAARVAELAGRASEEELAVINDTLTEQLAPAQGGSNQLLQQYVKHFGVLDGVESLREELFERFQLADAALEMERVALGHISPSRLEALSDRRLSMLGEAYGTGRFGEDAQRVATALRQRGKEETATQIEAYPEVGAREVDREQWSKDVELTWDSVRTMRGRSNSVSGIRYLPTRRLAGDQLRGWHVVRESSNPLAIRDPNGLVHPISIEQEQRQGSDLPKTLVSGGVMIVVLSDQIVALDLYRTFDNDTPVLWSRSTGGDGGSIAKRRSVMNVFDDQVLLDVINTNVPSSVTAEFRVGPITGDRLLILQGGELVCLDLMTSEQLWRNSDAPLGGAVVCDDQRVAVVSPEADEVVFFNLLDGEKLASEPWNGGDLWAGTGEYVLCYDQADDAPTDDAAPETPAMYDIRLIDPFTDDVLLHRRAAPANRRSENVEAAYGQVVEGRYLALFDTEGTAVIWDLVEARQLAELEDLPKYDDLNGLQAVLLEEQFLLLPRRRQMPKEESGTATLQTANMPNHQRVDAVISVSLEQGEHRWTEQFDAPWGCTLAQPSAIPILTLTRGWSDFNATGSRKRELEVLAMDVRDGDTLVQERREVPSGANLIETVVAAQPEQRRVTCRIGAEELTFDFADTPDSRSR